MVLFGAKNTLLRERKPALGQMGAGWGMQMAVQQIKISPASKTCDMSDDLSLTSCLSFYILYSLFANLE